ncbi:MAG: alcohol dehydrogenase catalytic domain-containing protein [Planctomycetota bacterium]|nr:alcohol dehydrogenase catalytic domain-containing protein [Planctomycetota bacterium]
MTGRMRAVVIRKKEKGSIAVAEDMPIPIPGQGEVLIRVLAAGICGSDRHLYNWDPSARDWINDTPRIIGHEFCGEVAEVGPGVPSPPAEGTYVSAEMHETCGQCFHCRTGQGNICEKTIIYGYQKDGCFAEYVKVPASNVIPLPRDAIPHKVGAFLDALGNAVHSTQKVNLAGRSILVLGYGPIGAMTAAVAHFVGASGIFIAEVGSFQLEKAREWARSVSEERGGVGVKVFDVSKGGEEAIEDTIRDTSGGVDVVFEQSGSSRALNDGLRMVRNGGHIVLLGIPGTKDMTIEDYGKNVIFKGITLHGVIGRRMFKTWYHMLALLKSGLSVDHVVTQEYPLSDFDKGMAAFNGGESLKVVLFNK